MPDMNMIEAIRDALDVKMSQDSDVLVFGEDVGYFGGVFRATAGLQCWHSDWDGGQWVATRRRNPIR